jgi:hypothetical protein
MAANSPATGSVSLSGPAPEGGALVYLESANTNVATVPASVTIAEGKTSANFVATAKPVSAQSSTTITGNHAGSTQTITISVLPPFDAWRAQYFPKDLDNAAISGALADPDGDGIVNLLENKLALSPTTRDSLPEAFRENGRLTMTFRVLKSATDIALKVQVANDPAGLAQSTPNDTSLAVIAEDTETQTIRATDVAAPLGATRRVMRLSVEH